MGGVVVVILAAIAWLCWLALANGDRRGPSGGPIAGVILVVVGAAAAAIGTVALASRSMVESCPGFIVRLAAEAGDRNMRDVIERVEIGAVVGLGGGTMFVLGGLYLLVTAARRPDGGATSAAAGTGARASGVPPQPGGPL